MRRAVQLLALALTLSGPALAAGLCEAQSLPGQRIYREGVLPSGQPLHASVQQGVRLSGAAAACATCHRRSGLGGSEGGNIIRPIAGRLLFAPSPSAPAASEKGRSVSAAAGAPARPVYTGAALARALREGIDPAGRALDALMPRYSLSETEAAQLHDYLARLSCEPAPGVSQTQIHFATIIAPGVSAEKTQAMLDVLRAFISDKNAGTRQETRRRDIGQEQMYRAYRRWELHAWELSGPPHTWQAQLAALYRQQPVFAVIGGIGGGSWEPVHAFCEAFEVPCVFPDVDYPVTQAAYYPLYFSRGVALEGSVLAKHLRQSAAQHPRPTIAQVYRDTPLGRLPAQALRQGLQGGDPPTLIDYPLTDAGPLPQQLLSILAGRPGPDVLVLWLDAADVQQLGLAGAPPPRLQDIYLSANLSELRRPDLPDTWLDRVRMVYPFDLPQRRERRLERMKVWLRAKKMALTHERTQANAFFTVTVAGDAVAQLGENFSRDYFLERIEQMTETSLSPSIYPHLSLGPGQRFASRGGYVVSFPAAAERVPVPLSPWLVP